MMTRRRLRGTIFPVSRPEQVPPPAADAAEFRSRAGYTFGVQLGIVAGVWFPALAVVQLVFVGTWPWSMWLATAVGAVASAGFSTLLSRRRPTWVRVSSAGLELAIRGSNPVLLPWPGIASVRWRRRFGSSVLEITPMSWQAVRIRADAGPLPTPAIRHSQPVFIVDAWLLRPGRAALHNALAHYLSGSGVAGAGPAEIRLG